MKFQNTKGFEIEGHLDISVASDYDSDFTGSLNGISVLIHGDKKGLKSLAGLLLYLAQLDQEEVDDKLLPSGAREHTSLRPNLELSKSSNETINRKN